MFKIEGTESVYVYTVPSSYTISKINSFSTINNGWHYGRGRPPSASTISMAASVNNFLVQVGLTTTDAFPGIDGEIMVTAYLNDLYCECIVESNGTYSVNTEVNSVDVVSCKNMSEADVIGTLFGVARTQWNISGSSTLVTTMAGEESSKVLLSGTHQTGPVFQSYSVGASINTNMVGANISGGTIEQSHQNPQFFGVSVAQPFRPAISSSMTTPTGTTVTT